VIIATKFKSCALASGSRENARLRSPLARVRPKAKTLCQSPAPNGNICRKMSVRLMSIVPLLISCESTRSPEDAFAGSRYPKAMMDLLNR
jgi:hypothetical protein